MIQTTLKKTVSVFVFLSLFAGHFIAQTGGRSDLSSIESKANMILKKDDKVGALNRQHLETYSLEADKLAQLREIRDKLSGACLPTGRFKSSHAHKNSKSKRESTKCVLLPLLFLPQASNSSSN